jgi:hypothetical protein
MKDMLTKGLKCMFAALLSIYSPSLSQAKETPAFSQTFYTQLEEEANEFYDRHVHELSHIKRAHWRHLVRVSLYRVKSYEYLLKEAQDFVEPAAKTFLITNILSTFVIPPILTAIGRPELAFLVIMTPFEPFLAGAQVIVANSYTHAMRMFKMGTFTYGDYIKMRHEILGMGSRNHILTLIEKDILKELGSDSETRWLVVTNSKKHLGNIQIDNSISIQELEEIVKSDLEHHALLNEILVDKSTRDRYALELWGMIMNSSGLRQKLKEALKHRVQIRKNVYQLEASRHLHTAIDLKRTLRERNRDLKIKLNYAGRNASQKEVLQLKILHKKLTDFTEQTIREYDLKEFEFVVQLSKGQKPLVHMEQSLKSLYELNLRLSKFKKEALLFNQDRFMTVDGMVNKHFPELVFLAESKAASHNWGGLQRSLANFSKDCGTLLRSLSAKHIQIQPLRSN